MEHGIICDLKTGQEKFVSNHSTHVSCTTEVADLNRVFDCAVIDEIQLIDHLNRGFSWSNALLGLQCPEIHLCGEGRALKLIHEICKETGDDLIKRDYIRLGTLETEKEPLSSLNDIKQGDCIVGFSIKELFKIRNTLNQKSFNCGIIYGSLPPYTKKEQIKSFNNPDNRVRILCATDAVKYFKIRSEWELI